MKIAVTGATGKLGTLVVEQLKSKVGAENVVALVRTPEKAAGFGVEARAFDYNNAEVLAGALEGVDRLLLISSSEIGERERHHTNVISAAKVAGVDWIVYTSLLHADTSTLNLAGEHLVTEKALKESGLTYTILRHGWYTENYTMSIEGSIGAGAFLGSAGEGKIASATRADFAEADATVIINEAYKGKVLELAGNTAYTLSDLAAEVTKQIGKELPYNNVPEATYAEILVSIGVPEGFAAAIASWDVSASKDDLFDDKKGISAIIGRPTTSLADAVKAVLK